MLRELALNANEPTELDVLRTRIFPPRLKYYRIVFDSNVIIVVVHVCIVQYIYMQIYVVRANSIIIYCYGRRLEELKKRRKENSIKTLITCRRLNMRCLKFIKSIIRV